MYRPSCSVGGVCDVSPGPVHCISCTGPAPHSALWLVMVIVSRPGGSQWPTWQSRHTIQLLSKGIGEGDVGRVGGGGGGGGGGGPFFADGIQTHDVTGGGKIQTK